MKVDFNLKIEDRSTRVPIKNNYNNALRQDY